MAAMSAKENKFFEVLTMAITGIATCAYLTMYTGAGYSWINEVAGEVDPFYWALYQKVSSMTIVLWALYPLVWVLAEGLRVVSPSLEACMYMIMDVLSKCLFGFFIVQG